MESRITQPKWNSPEPHKDQPELVVMNSLTRKKEKFVTLKPGFVSWYSCGPTVYDAAHLGHARNYMSIDMNRRILEDYFGYNVNFVQNVTDIDDKIIVRARQNFLFEKFSADVTSDTLKLSDAQQQAKASMQQYAEKNLAKYSPDVANSKAFQAWLSTQDAKSIALENPKFTLHTNNVQQALLALESTSVPEFLEGVKSVMQESLDKEHGAEVTDHSVFRKLSSYFEADFDDDMAKLNVKPPTITTRVSEYIPEVIVFVEQIIKKGFAYSAEDGSVYFDVAAFEKSPKHFYAKLQPWNKGVQDLIDDGEGSLSTKVVGKKSNSDFALWKTSKPGEPRWSSPWGEGRPGWHIECSVMACHVFGSRADVHSGGEDLAFPHHDNEVAQTEACFDESQWINYFLHTGHLHIEGQKMSKSLKNFISIKEALKMFTPRQLRLAFAQQVWSSQLDFKMSMPNVKSAEASLTNLFNKINALKISTEHRDSRKVGDLELSLLNDLQVAQADTNAAFCDSFNIPKAISAILALVQKANEYEQKATPSDAGVRLEPLIAVGSWITKILRILGFEMDKTLGWAASGSGTKASTDAIVPLAKVVSAFRDLMRSHAIESKPVDQFILNACDDLRDDGLFNLNIALDDRKAGMPALVKLITEEEKLAMIEERKQAEAEAARKNEQKLANEARRKAEEEERAQKASVKPEEMFLNSPEFSKFDDKGVPTHDASGEALSKNAVKKLLKQWTLQKKLYDQFH